jgi:predicted ABC-type transport system involved in lysophospholipase L1 biosynthesis ATPase subunit
MRAKVPGGYLPPGRVTAVAGRQSAVNRTWVGRAALLSEAGPAASLIVMENVVELEAVTRRYGSRRRPVTALCEVSLAVPAGQFVAVMGATGSGKSTLLHCAAGLDRPTSGRVRLAGQDVTRMREGALTRLRRDRVGFVFQSYNLLSELSVRQNVLLPRRLGGPPPRPVDEVLAEVGLAGLGGGRSVSCPAASASGWRSRGRWQPDRRWCSPTSRPGRWIP